MEVLPAGTEHAARVMEIITLCKEQMRASGSDQWDDVYPTLDVVEADVRAGSLFVLWTGDELIGAVCLNEAQAAEYASVSWRYEGRALVVHRLCVDPRRQGMGAARVLMDFAENFAWANGYAAIRLDTYTGNARAMRLYEARGYQKAGQVSFPRRKLRFDCFERSVFPE